MPTDTHKSVISEFPLQLTSEARQDAEQFSAKEGVSLNQFINMAVAEKLDHLKHQEWARNRQKPTPELAEMALKLLDKNRGRPVVPGDELPEGYIRS